MPETRVDMIKVDIAIFAHNEGEKITSFLQNLFSQSIFGSREIDLNIYLLANGCTDDTVKKANKFCGEYTLTGKFKVLELEMSGKSRTWNRFVHEISRTDAEYLVFMDSDIYLNKSDSISHLVQKIRYHTTAMVIVSKPVKDITLASVERLTLVEKLIASGDTAESAWNKTICGQLYVMIRDAARAIFLPVGLPVEDGFIRAMVLTNILTEKEDFDLIDGFETISHVFYAERTISGLIHHQTRLIIGGAINSAVFRFLMKLPAHQRALALQSGSENEAWLAEIVKQELPTWSYGWVPFPFLTKRTANSLRSREFRASKMAKIALGFCFDLLVYIISQVRMARGTGVGFW